MQKNNKVAWMESQYLYPHHFQQQERYFEDFVDRRVRPARSCLWGFTELSINTNMLLEGRVAITSAKGIMPDGTPFTIPGDALLPEPVTVKQQSQSFYVHLALPIYQDGNKFLDAGTGQKEDGIARYRLQTIDVFDYSSVNTESEAVESAVLQFSLMSDDDKIDGYTTLPIGRVKEITSEGAIIFEKEYVYPVLNLKAHPYFQSYISDTLSMLGQRGEAIAQRFGEGNDNGSSAISDFMLLQIINRYEPRLRHLGSLNDVHPETLYYEMLGAVGEISSFNTTTKRPPDYMEYDQTDVYPCFQHLTSALSICLSSVLEQTAIALPVEERQFGIRVSRITDRSLLSDARFIIAIKANMPTDKLRKHLPDHMKIGSVDTIRDLVNNQLTGITLNTLAVAPREIPYHSGFIYFELNSQGDQWASLKKAAGFAFHIAGELDDIKVEFWAVRS